MQSFKSIKGWLCLALALSLVVPTALAALDTNRQASLSVSFQPDGAPAPGVEFRLYRVGSVSSSGQYSLVAPFQDYPVSVEDPQTWGTAAETMETYLAMKGHADQYAAKASTSSGGWANFSGLQTGLYLLVGDTYTTREFEYLPRAVLIALPTQNAAGQWIYTLQAKVKYEKLPFIGPEEHPTKIHAVKIWKDEGAENQRPQEVTIKLLRDGEVYDTVTLSADNNWRHSWEVRDEGNLWQVVEDPVPTNYTVAIRSDAPLTFAVENTYDKPDDPPDEPGKPDKPDQPDQPDSPDQPSTPNRPGQEHLPQTGMLWWPVPILAVGGMGCFLVGWVKDRKDEDDET